jgi:GH35 family endo-1,4-beta-xylanase
MNSQGVLNFTNADNVLTQLKAAGLTVYGHTLVWHNQQQAGYINSLLKPVIIPGTPGSSLIANGDFEIDLTGWDIPYYKEAVTQSADFAIDSEYSMKIAVGDWGGGKYNMQINSPSFSIISGHRYEISFFIRSDIAGSVGLDFPSGDLTNQYPQTGGNDLTPTGASWTKITYNPTTTPDGMVATADNTEMTFRFLLGSTADCTYYIDAVEVIDLDAAPDAASLRADGPTEMPQTEEEKAHKVDSVLQAWIKGMTEHFQDDVVAWDVVNEPMNENGTLREGSEDLSSTSTFYWQYYLGKEYAVKAFKYAKEGDPDAKLFINDYNLESASGSKLDGLIEYVRYIESQGAEIDGIGTQMHLNINWADTSSIKTMFQKLAATGKLIKISELDIAIANSSNPESPVSPTAEQYAQQAELYRFVAAMYNQYIPQAQRYGITVWEISDNETEHEYWLKNDAPCIWNADYARKHAYKGFADGLAGKDVSADFTGELVY